jgi:IS1 family transposase
MRVTGAKSRGGRSSDVERNEGKEEGKWNSTENWCAMQELQDCEPQKKLNKRQKRRTSTNTNERHGSNEIRVFLSSLRTAFFRP